MSFYTHDRHLRAWLIWLLSSLFLFYKYAIEVSPSVMTAQLMAEFSIDGEQLGHLAACYFYSYLLMQIPAGLLIDRLGARYVTTTAIILCSIGSIILSCAHELPLALIGRFLSGFGAAFSALNCLKLTASWFPKRRFALMAGLMMTVGMLGAVFGQAPLFQLIHKLGWRTSLEMMGYVGIALAAVFFMIVRDEPHPHLSLREDVISLKEGLKSLFHQPQAWLLSVYSGLAFAPVTVFGGLWGVPFLTTAFSCTAHQAAQAVSMIFIGFAIGAPMMGYLSDKIGSRKKILYIGTFMAFLTMSFVLFGGKHSYILMSSLLFLFGFFISGFLVSFTMIKEITLPVFAATSIGFMNSFDALIGSVSDPLTGKILDLFWDGKIKEGARVFSERAYHLSLSTLAVYLIVSFVLIFFIKETAKETSHSSKH